MSEIKDRLRALTVGAAKVFGEEIVEYQGEKFKIRQPSVAQRAQIMQAAKIVARNDKEEIDFAKMQIWAVICCTYTVDNEPVFTTEDFASLEANPCGTFIDEFAEVALRLMNVEAANKAKN